MWNCSLRRKRTPSKSSRSDKTVPENFAAYPAGFSGSFLLIAQSVLGTAFPAVSICLATIFSNSPRNRCTICNTIIPEVRNAFTLLNGQIAVDQKQSVGGYFQLFAQSSIFSIINASAGRFGFHPEEFSVDGNATSSSCVLPADAASERITLEQSETSAPCSS